MTTYNGQSFLKKQLDSILNQTVKVDEIIVCDDGSTDDTHKILDSYVKNGIVKFEVNTINLGFVKNFEKALSLCTGEYIFLADQDDVWYPNKVEVLLQSIGGNLLVHSDCDLIDSSDELVAKNFKGQITTHQTADDFLFANVVTGCTVLIHRDLLKFALPFPDGLAYHDWYLALHAAYLERIAYVSQSLTGYRQHQLQDTGSGESGKSSILRNCRNRIRGVEFLQIKSTKKQLANLKSCLFVFSEDVRFQKKLKKVIGALEGYVSDFFHFSYGYWFSKTFFKNEYSRFRRLLVSLKYSIG